MAQDPATWTLESFFTTGIGSWNSTLAAVSVGAFSSAPPEPEPPVGPLSSLPPSDAEFPPLSSRSFAYQTPPPMISAMAATAATMIQTWADSPLRPPPCGACAPSGTVGAEP